MAGALSHTLCLTQRDCVCACVVCVCVAVCVVRVRAEGVRVFVCVCVGGFKLLAGGRGEWGVDEGRVTANGHLA